jgi:hypothetical protein
MVFIFLAAVIAVSCFSVKAMTPEEFGRQSGLQKKMECAESVIDKIYHGKGTVVYGRLIAAPDAAVEAVSRVLVNQDGYFACNVYWGRTLCFYRHGYEPVRIQVAENGPRFLDAGNIAFTKLPAEKTFSVEGRVVLDESLRQEKISVTLGLAMPPQVFWDDGNECGARTYRQVAAKTISNGDIFRFDGLSPVKYQLEIRTGKSFVKRIFFNNTGRVKEFTAAGDNDNAFEDNDDDFGAKPKLRRKPLKVVVLPAVTLSAAPIVRFSLQVSKVTDIIYAQASEDNSVPPVFEPEIRTFERLCNGETTIPVASRMEIHSNNVKFWRNHELYLETNEKNHIVPEFRFGVNYFYDFGRTTFEEARQKVNTEFMKKSRAPKIYSYRVGKEVMTAKVEEFKREVSLEDGHAYYFEYPFGKIYFLMKTDFVTSK